MKIEEKNSSNLVEFMAYPYFENNARNKMKVKVDDIFVTSTLVHVQAQTMTKLTS